MGYYDTPRDLDREDAREEARERRSEDRYDMLREDGAMLGYDVRRPIWNDKPSSQLAILFDGFNEVFSNVKK